MCPGDRIARPTRAHAVAKTGRAGGSAAERGMDNPAAPVQPRAMDADVLIAGGGLNGPALALALAQGGLRVTVVDARPAPAREQPGFDGRAYALAIASRRLLSAIGIWGGVAAKAQPIMRIEVTDGRVPGPPSPLFLAFDAAEIEEGPMGHMLEDRFLYAAFLAAMRAEPRITLLPGESVVAQEAGAAGVTVVLASGGRLAARALVGCDGRGSGVAARAGIGRITHRYGQTALVTALHHEGDHRGTAHEYFLPAGPFAILPLAGGHHSSIVWCERHADAEAIDALPDADYLVALRARFGDFLGPLTLAGPRFRYPLSLSLAERFVAARVALVGDAAHGVHPVAGQGLNLGLRDVGALAEVLVRAHRRGEDIGSAGVLDEYQRWRRFDATALSLGMDALVRLFSNDDPLLRLGRDLGIGAVNRIAPLRRRFIRQAAGLTGALPRLLAGRPI